MKWYQKIRVLNFCRTWFESNMYLTEKIVLHKELYQIVNAGLSLNHEEITKSCLELEQIVKSWNPETFHIKCISNPLKIQDELKHRNKSDAFIASLAADLRLLAAESIIFLSPFNILAEEKDSSSDYYNHVVNFVVNTIISFEDESLEKKIEMVTYFLEFFIDLAVNLSEKNDFFSSFAIFSALNLADISSFFKVYDKKNKSTENKIILSKEYSKKWIFLQDLFNYNLNYKAVNSRIQECDLKKDFVVPIPALFKTWMFHSSTFNKSLEIKLNLVQPDTKPIVNVEKFASQTNQILEINKYLNEIRDRFVRLLKEEIIHSDMRQILEVSREFNEKKLEKFAKEIFPTNSESIIKK